MQDLKAPKDRDLFFSFQVDQKTISDLSKEIVAINKDDDYLEQIYKASSFKYLRSPILVYIDSYGGNVYQCFGLISLIENSKTPVHTIVTGCAISCGFLILIAGHKRFAHKHSTMLYHQVSNGVQSGKFMDMAQDLKEVERLQRKIEDLVLEKTKIGKKALKKSLKQKTDWFIEPKAAKELGVIDEII